MIRTLGYTNRDVEGLASPSTVARLNRLSGTRAGNFPTAFRREKQRDDLKAGAMRIRHETDLSVLPF